MTWVSYSNPCPKCGSSDAVAIDDKDVGYCFSCQTIIKDKIERPSMPLDTKPKKLLTVKEIQELPIIALEDRGISQEAAEFFGVRTSFSEETGEPEYRYFPYYQGDHLCYKRKCIKDKKDQSLIGHNRGVSFNLFGQHLTKGTNFLVVVEGEEDTLAAYDILKSQKKSYNVVSLPNGANVKSIQDNYKWLYEFTTITICFDNDTPGHKAADQVSKLFDPGQVKVAELKDLKDTNDYLKADKNKEWLSSIYNAAVRKPTGIITISDIWDQALKKPEYGEPWPWPTLTKLTYGRRPGEIYGIAATAGAGKTEFAKEIVYQTIFVDKSKIACAFLEEAAPLSAKRIAGKLYNQPFHIPDVDYNVEDLEDALRQLDNKLWLYEHSGYKSWADIKQYFKYCNRALGINDFILDNLTAITAQEENEYTALNRIMEELSSLANELESKIYYMAHLRKATGTDHANGGQISLVELKGSGAIANWSNYIFALERNTQSPDPNVRNTSTLRVLKDRMLGLSVGSTIELWYDHNTARYREKTEEDGVEIDY